MAGLCSEDYHMPCPRQGEKVTGPVAIRIYNYETQLCVGNHIRYQLN